jgi:hypothetical protein
VAPASAMAMSTAILIFAVFIRASGPRFIRRVIFAHVFVLDGKGGSFCSTLKIVRSFLQLLCTTVMSSSSVNWGVHCVGVVIVVILKQISLLKLLSLYAPNCHMFLRCHP